MIGVKLLKKERRENTQFENIKNKSANKEK